MKAAEGEHLIFVEEMQGISKPFSLSTVFHNTVEQFMLFLKPPIVANKRSLFAKSHNALIYYMNMRVLRSIYNSKGNEMLRNCISLALAVQIYNANSSSFFLPSSAYRKTFLFRKMHRLIIFKLSFTIRKKMVLLQKHAKQALNNMRESKT